MLLVLLKYTLITELQLRSWKNVDFYQQITLPPTLKK